ncbi:MAG: glycosyltransferase family 39 protein [Candidatus Brocadia sp.]
MVIFPALGQTSHLASREIRHAEIIREMAESGDYLVPKLLGKTYYDKPPIMHAPAAFLTRMIGKPSMDIARMPSAVAGMLGILATYGLGLLLFDRRSALVGAIALLGVPGYGLMAREARPDMILCASMLFSCLCLGLGMREEKHIPRIFYFVLAGLLTGLGVVTKGPYGLVVPALFAIFTPFRRQDLKRPRFGWIVFVLGLVTTMAIWAIPAYLHDGGEYLRGVIFQPDLDISQGGRSGKSVFYYVWHGILLTIPLSLFLPYIFMNLRRCGYSAPLAIAGAIFIIISCIPKKRPHYMVPLYPFLSLGITASIVRHSVTSRIVLRAAWVLISISVVAMPIYFVAIQPIVQPYKNSQIFFAKEVLAAIEPNSRIYCVTGIDEALAWVGRRYEGIRKLDRKDSSIGTTLREAGAGSYLVISEKNLTSLLKGKETVPGELILNRKVGHEKMMLFRLKGKISEVPR